MADERRKHPRGKADEAFLLGEEEEDGLFKAQMALANVVLGYWKYGLVFLGLVLVATLGWGTWKNHVRDTQREIQAAIARVEKGIPKTGDGLTTPLIDPSQPGVLDKVRDAAQQLEVIAEDGTGAGRTFAWIRAGELWDIAGESDRAATCFENAWKSGGKGVLGWSATVRAARARAARGDLDGAVAMLQDYAAGDDIYAQQSLFEIGTMQLDAGRTDAARATFEDFAKRFPDSYLGGRVASALRAASAGSPAASPPAEGAGAPAGDEAPAGQAG